MEVGIESSVQRSMLLGRIWAEEWVRGTPSEPRKSPSFKFKKTKRLVYWVRGSPWNILPVFRLCAVVPALFVQTPYQGESVGDSQKQIAAVSTFTAKANTALDSILSKHDFEPPDAFEIKSLAASASGVLFGALDVLLYSCQRFSSSLVMMRVVVVPLHLAHPVRLLVFCFRRGIALR